jgi:hypothetical protein
LLGLLILNDPNPYNFIFFVTNIAISITDWDAYFGDAFFCIISTMIWIYSIYSLFIYYHLYQSKEVLLIIFLFMIVNVLEIKLFIPSGIFKDLFTQLLHNDETITEVSNVKLLSRFTTVLLLIFMVTYGNKMAVDYFTITNTQVLDTLQNFCAWYIGYYITSCISQYYVLYLKKSYIKRIKRKKRRVI